MRYSTIIVSALVLLQSAFAVPHSPEGPQVNRLLAPGKRIILFGVYGGAGLVSHSGPFSTRADGYECCTYTDGSGMAFFGGLKAVIPLEKRFFIIPTLAVQSMDGEFDSDPYSYPILGIGNTMEMADFENTLDVTLSNVTIGVHAAYVVSGFGLYITAGPSLSYVLSKEFASTDRITGPPGVRFLDGTTEKEVYRGDIDIAQSTYFSIEGGAGVMLEVARSVFVNPEVLYALPVTTLSKTDDWKIGGVQGSIGVLFAL